MLETLTGSQNQEALGAAPGLCGCEDCVEEGSQEESNSGREECANTQTGSVGVARGLRFPRSLIQVGANSYQPSKLG